MAVKITQPARNLREELNELRTPTGIAGEAMMRADTPQEQFNLIGAGRKNLIINGDFQVWQRGTSFVNQGNQAYNADRFLNGSSTPVYTTTKGTATVDGKSVNTHRTDVTSSATVWLDSCYQVIEDYKLLDGQYVTMSAWVRTDIPNINFRQWATANHSDVFPADGQWHYVTTTFKANCSAGAVKNLNGSTFGIVMSGSSALSSGQFLEVAMFQLELGKVATPFEHRSYGEELALCQRYYLITQTYRSGYIVQATGGVESTPFPVNMRTAPTLNIITNDAFINCTGVAVFDDDNQGFRHHPSGGTSNIATRYRVRISADAEL